VVETLGLPDLYPQLVSLLEVHRLESDELIEKATALRGLLGAYARA